jgi:hypothetical protein
VNNVYSRGTGCVEKAAYFFNEIARGGGKGRQHRFGPQDTVLAFHADDRDGSGILRAGQ